MNSTINCFVILNYNDYFTTYKCAEQILNYSLIDKIIIVDNKSPDGSYQKLKKKFNNVKKVDVIQTERNGGYAYGNNFGFRYAIKKYNPKYFFVSNPDVFIPEETIREIIDFYEKRSQLKKIGIISARMIEKDRKNSIAWKLPNFGNDVILSIGFLYKLLGNPTKYDEEYLSSGEYVEVDVLPGSFFFISSNALQEVSFFDEKTFLFGEERILSYKLIKKGYKNYLLSKAMYYHYAGSSINKNINAYLKQYILLQNSREYYHRYYLKDSKLKILFFRLVTYLGTLEKLIYFTFIRNKNPGKENIIKKGFQNSIKWGHNISKRLIREIILLLNFITPKDPRSIVFMSFPDFSDNSRALYEYMRSLPDSLNYKLIWLVYNKTSLEQLQSLGVQCYYIKSAKGIMKWLRTKFIISSTGILSIKSCRQVGINLWHGMPLKAMGFIDKSLQKSDLEESKKGYGKIDLLISTSSIMRNALSACFYINPKKIAITGQPRNDKLFSPNSRKLLANFLQIDIDYYKKVVLFAPTFREGFLNRIEGKPMKNNNFLRLTNFNSKVFENFLINNKILFLLKFHPFEESTVQSRELVFPKNVMLLHSQDLQRKCLDLYDILGGIDILVTDYSSIYFDFLLLNRPIIFIPIDLKEYRKARGFALEPYEFWTPGPKVTDFENFIAELEKFINTPRYYRKEREMVNSLVNKYKDGRSAERVYKIIKFYI